MGDTHPVYVIIVGVVVSLRREEGGRERDGHLLVACTVPCGCRQGDVVARHRAARERCIVYVTGGLESDGGTCLRLSVPGIRTFYTWHGLLDGQRLQQVDGPYCTVIALVVVFNLFAYTAVGVQGHVRFAHTSYFVTCSAGKCLPTTCRFSSRE